MHALSLISEDHLPLNATLCHQTKYAMQSITTKAISYIYTDRSNLPHRSFEPSFTARSALTPSSLFPLKLGYL